MNQKNFVKMLVIVLIIIVLGIIGWLVLRFYAGTVSSQPASNPSLNQEQAQDLVLQTWGGCTPDICRLVMVTVQNNNGQYLVTAMYDGLYDDSVSTQKKAAVATYRNNVWVLGEATITQRCQPGRGHQDFSSIPCF